MGVLYLETCQSKVKLSNNNSFLSPNKISGDRDTKENERFGITMTNQKADPKQSMATCNNNTINYY